MKYPSLRFVFDRRNIATQQRKASVYLEVAFRRKRRDVPTGIHLYADEWDNRKRVVNRSDACILNTQLDAIQTKVRTVLLGMQNNNEEFSFEKFDVYIKGADESGSFIDFMYDRIEKRNIEKSTKKQHYTAYNLLDKFGKIKSFSDLTPAMLKAFDDFIREDNKDRSQVTIHGIHKRIKPYVTEAYELGHIKENPYSKFQVSRGKSKDREFLNMTEIELIKDKRGLNDCLDRVRDLFLFGCFTGMAYSDIEKFNADRDIITDGDARFITGKRQKTDTTFYVMVLPQIEEILNKYNGRLPVISLTKYNLFLKALGVACGISKTLSSHIARHTFATTVTLANDVPLEVVGKMLGHTDIRTTQIYAKILNSSIAKHMKGVSEKLNK